MRFLETSLPGVLRVESEPHADERGSFTRLHCEREFAARGLPARMVQTSVSHTRRRGSVRGLHFQWPPSREGKLVRCLAGRIHDAVVDLRPSSPSFMAHATFELDEMSDVALYIPPGFAHGFQTLRDDCRVLYQMTDVYSPELASGVRWNDPTFGIAWPLPLGGIHPRDAAYPDFNAELLRQELQVRGSWDGVP